MDTTYSIVELEQATGVPRRTIYYYTMEKLIPPPTGAGLAARYGEVHYLRLKLISQMQKAHIRLSGIREALDALTIEEMRNLIGQIDVSTKAWSMPALQNWVVGQKEDQKEPEQKSTKAPAKNYSFLSEPARSEESTGARPTEFLSQLKRKLVVDTTSWQRYIIFDGLEISVRSDIAARYGVVLLDLLEQFKKHL